MDPRLSDLPEILGLPRADIDVIRTGGPAVTQDVLAELVVSTRILGSREIMLLNHTGCGFTTFTDDDLNAKLSALTGDASPAPMRFFSYKDPSRTRANRSRRSERIRGSPEKFPCAVLFSTSRPVCSGRSSRFHSTWLREGHTNRKRSSTKPNAASVANDAAPAMEITG